MLNILFQMNKQEPSQVLKGTQKNGIRERQEGNFAKSTLPIAKVNEYKIKELTH